MRKIAALFLFVCLLFIACKSPTTQDNKATTSTSTSTTTSIAVIPPKPGTWNAPTEFGSFDFVVNDSSTYITKITFNFAGWMGRSGGVAVSKDPGWTIANRAFKIETGILNDQWTIEGTFDSGGSKASGTWKAVIGGQTLNGTWQGQPKS